MYRLVKELPNLQWRALTAHTSGCHFVVQPRGPRWYWRVRVDNTMLGEGMVHDSSMIAPRGYSTSAEARGAAQDWYREQVLAGRVS